MYREALAIDKKIYGEEHPDVARDLNNLALLLSDHVSFGSENVAAKFLCSWEAFSNTDPF